MTVRPFKLAFCPIGKFVFSHEDALRQKQAIRGVLERLAVDYVDLETVLPDGMVRDHKHVEPVVEHFRGRHVDGLFIPHCNFGTEGAAGEIARRLEVPTLLWGPRDEAPLPDGTRLRDSLCGLLATSKVLVKLGVTFTYLPNCRVDDPEFAEGLDTFVRAACVANTLRRGCRIGMIGQRIDFFWSTRVDHDELRRRFNIEVVTFDLPGFIESCRERARSQAGGYEKEAKELGRRWIIEDMSPQALINVLAVRDQTLAICEASGLDACTCESFMSLPEAMGAWTMAADSMISETVPFAMESDVCGAVSTLLLACAAMGRAPAWLVDLCARHPTDDNAVLVWHAGAPVSMKHPDDRVRLGKHWILPGPLSGMTHFRLKDGPMTCARFDGDHGRYALAVGEGESCEGPFTLNNYVWMRVRHWPNWERNLIEGPFLHHIGMTYGRYARVLKEAARYVPGLALVDLDAEPKDNLRSATP